MEKPHWISIDFTRWEYQKESDDEEEEMTEGEGLDPEKNARVVSACIYGRRWEVRIDL